MELVRLENITKTYHLGAIDVPVLRGVSLSIARGEMVALMGVSGSGKTTLMNILGCLDRPSSGRYLLDGQEMSDLTPNQRALVRTAKLGFVFQNFNLLPRTSATQNVIMPLSYAPRHSGSGESRRRAQSLLELVGLAERCDHEPSQMSGGQQQRVAIARALVNHPALLLADEPTGNLDSHTSVEILHMFQRLNSEGITVILVTHDAKVAAYAHRTIRIADGLIEADETIASSTHAGWTAVSSGQAADGNGNADGGGQPAALLGAGTATAVAESGDPASPTAATAVAGPTNRVRSDGKPKLRHAGSPSLVPSTFRTALGALRRNKMRSVLTGLGVIIGVGAVIAMTEIGQGSRKALEKTIASMGANNLLILPGAAMTGSVSFGTGTAQTLKPADMDEILRQCPAVAEVAPLIWARAQVVYGSRNWVPNSITGTTPSFLIIREWNLEEGDIFTSHDVHNGNTVCLIGATLKHELFQDESPVGKEIRIRNVPFRVIGVLASKGANMMGQDQDDTILAPWTAIKFRVNAGGAGSTIGAQSITVSVNSLSNLYPGGTALYPTPLAAQAADSPQPIRFVNVDTLIAKASSADQIPQATEEISGLLRERHRIPSGRGNDFEIRDMSEITRMIASATGLVSALLLVVAAISLVVGGVGIMNIMLVSVTERTREIGLRMAVGARSYHILQQFLVEAVLLCLVGGAIGIALGRGVSILVRSIKGWNTEASIPAIVVAVLVSVGVGVIFGFYPAWKASRLDPIEALRYE